MFARIGRWSYRHRRAVLGMWIAAIVVVAVSAGTLGGAFRAEQTIPGGESVKGFDVIDEYFEGAGSGQSGTIVFRADAGVDDPTAQAAMEDMFDEVAQIDGVFLTSPYSRGGERQIAVDGPDAGKAAYAVVDLDRDLDQSDTAEIGSRIDELRPEVEGLQVEIGGQSLAEFEPPESELIGVAFAVVVLIFAFGSVLAMGLPIGVAVAGVGIGIGSITLLSHVMQMPDFATTLGAMIGLGVGIDYALFIVSRHRENVHAGTSIEESVVASIDTAGRAVIFAGLTVVVSLLGLLLMGLPFVSGLGIGAATTVAITMAASVTLLPAFLGFAGGRIETTRVRGLVAAGLGAVALLGVGLGVEPLMFAAPLAVLVLIAGFFVGPLKREVPRREPKPVRETFWYRWSRVVQHHPWISVLGATVVLLVLAIPVLSLRLGFSDEGNFSEDTTTRKAYDILADGFGPGFNGPFVITAELGSPADAEALPVLVDALRATAGVASVSPPTLNDADTPAAALIRLIPTTSPQDEATVDLVGELRDNVVPAAVAGTGLEVSVSGSVAASIDFTDYLAGRLVLFFGVVLSLSFVLLMAVFRSLLVPVKAVIMNMLSIGAAYGIVVAIFQWGWAQDVVGISGGGPIEPFIPMMMFAIVFGLSMDYEVFLLSRIKEEFDRTGDAVNSVADGLAATARVISAAAAIMVVVFGSFVFEDDRVVKLFGLGLAVAVFLDATLVRMLLVPATMELLGERNWWLPRWLDRLLPRIDVEGPHEAPSPVLEPVGVADATLRDETSMPHGNQTTSRARPIDVSPRP
ncbi:MAG: MMPL family transporter [Acidimicrobiia bacterium]|nr:MMPL family transporter [Acidimicrobiia bacterium]